MPTKRVGCLRITADYWLVSEEFVRKICNSFVDVGDLTVVSLGQWIAYNCSICSKFLHGIFGLDQLINLKCFRRHCIKTRPPATLTAGEKTTLRYSLKTSRTREYYPRQTTIISPQLLILEKKRITEHLLLFFVIVFTKK